VASIAGMLLGLLVGLRHAFEPDHLTAMATLAAEARDPRRGALLGAIWGLGHTLALIAVGAILLAAGAALPARLGAVFELAVAGVLVALGVRAIAIARREGARGPAHRHSHRGRAHDHAGPIGHVHLRRAHGGRVRAALVERVAPGVHGDVRRGLRRRDDDRVGDRERIAREDERAGPPRGDARRRARVHHPRRRVEPAALGSRRVGHRTARWFDLARPDAEVPRKSFTRQAFLAAERNSSCAEQIRS
jgi:ABC-type nickel/cobalt efflux system permease component RcnA